MSHEHNFEMFYLLDYDHVHGDRIDVYYTGYECGGCGEQGYAVPA